MTLQEENQALREKLKEFQEVLKEAAQGVAKSGTLSSPILKRKARVTGDDGGEYILPVSPETERPLKKGDRVYFNQNMIVDVLHPELEKAQEEVHFDFIDWADIAGLDSQVSKIKETIKAPLLYGRFYKEYGLTPCKGILLYGPPGCGKTMVAKAIASYYLQGAKLNKDSFIYVKGGEMLRPLVGATEANIKSIFTRARQNFKKNEQKSVVFIDEAEAILPARGTRRSSDVEKTIVPTFLSEMDGFEENSTFIILATNYPGAIDAAVIRPGRIDLKIEIGRPNKEDSVSIFDLYLKKTRCSMNPCDLAFLAAEHLFKDTHEVSGALIKNIVDKAILSAIKRAAKGTNNGVTEDDIVNAILEV